MEKTRPLWQWREVRNSWWLQVPFQIWRQRQFGLEGPGPVCHPAMLGLDGLDTFKLENITPFSWATHTGHTKPALSNDGSRTRPTNRRKLSSVPTFPGLSGQHGFTCSGWKVLENHSTFFKMLE